LDVNSGVGRVGSIKSAPPFGTGRPDLSLAPMKAIGSMNKDCVDDLGHARFLIWGESRRRHAAAPTAAAAAAQMPSSAPPVIAARRAATMCCSADIYAASASLEASDRASDQLNQASGPASPLVAASNRFCDSRLGSLSPLAQWRTLHALRLWSAANVSAVCSVRSR